MQCALIGCRPVRSGSEATITSPCQCLLMEPSSTKSGTLDRPLYHGSEGFPVKDADSNPEPPMQPSTLSSLSRGLLQHWPTCFYGVQVVQAHDLISQTLPAPAGGIGSLANEMCTR